MIYRGILLRIPCFPVVSGKGRRNIYSEFKPIKSCYAKMSIKFLTNRASDYAQRILANQKPVC